MRYVIWISIVFLGVVLSGTGAHYGILMGVADYPGTENDLAYTDDDATAVYQYLKGDEALWNDEHLVLLLNEEATKANLLQALSDFSATADQDDTLVIYFSGHGTRGNDLVPLDELDGYDEYLCTYGELSEEYIRDDELSDWLSQVPFGRVIVIIDACFSGGEIRAAGRRVKSIWSGTGIPSDGFLNDLRASSLSTQDLDDISSKEIVALTAADDNQYAWELAPFNHGLFTYYFLEALTGWADGLTSLDGYISAEEAFTYLNPRVLAISADQDLNQAPQFFDTSPGEAQLLMPQRVCLSLSPEEDLAQAGWYMLAFPGIPCGSDDPEVQLGDDIYPLFLFHFDPSLGSYRMYPADPKVKLRAGWGYWLRVYEPLVRPDIVAWFPDSPAVVPLVRGWNQIGNPFPFAIPLAQLEVRYLREILPLIEAQSRGWVSAYLFGYDPEQKGYVMLDPWTGELSAWQGYWLRAYVECELFVRPQPVPPPPPPQNSSVQGPMLAPTEWPPPPPNHTVSPHPSVLVRAVPNPVRDVYTTVFVADIETESLRVEVYDLSGRLVWTGTAQGNNLPWHTQGFDGRPLANGVYLYRAFVKLPEGWVFAGAEKLAILR